MDQKAKTFGKGVYSERPLLMKWYIPMTTVQLPFYIPLPPFLPKLVKAVQENYVCKDAIYFHIYTLKLIF